MLQYFVGHVVVIGACVGSSIIVQFPLSRLVNGVVGMVELYSRVSERLFPFVTSMQVEGGEEKMDVDGGDQGDDELVRGDDDFPS